MKIAVVGGGPAGLYFSILMKKTNSEHDINVYEQNQYDDTFGFGVVFSDETLDNFLSHDPKTYEKNIKESHTGMKLTLILKDRLSALKAMVFADAAAENYYSFCKNAAMSWV